MYKLPQITAVLAATLIASSTATAAVFNVDDATGLRNALANVQAGDEIVVAAGATIQFTNGALNGSYFYSNAEGTAANPITIRSASSSDPAEIKGNDTSSKIVLRIEGDHWIVRDLILSGGQKGLVFDNSNFSQAIDLEVHNVGYEAIHVRDGSDNVIVDGCTIYNTGVVRGQFGEGLYIGTDRSSWGTYDKDVRNTIVRNCTIGPNVGAEAFDIKEGTYNTIVEFNEIIGTGISAEAFEDSFIDLKGIRSIIRNNTFTQGNEPKILRAIAIVDRDRPDDGSFEHVIHDNVFNMDDTTTPLIQANSGTRDIYAYDNARNPAGEMYNSRVTQGQAPFYDGGNGGGGTPNQAPTVSLTSPSDGATATEGDSVTLAANASDSDGSIANVAFFIGSSRIGSNDTSVPYSRNWTAGSPGTYSVTAVATDNDGATRTSAARSITVQAANTGGGGGNASPSIESVSSQQSNNPAVNLLDGDTADSSRWSASGFPQNVVIDLGSEQTLTGARLSTYQDRAYQYTIATSNSPSSGFTTRVDRSSNTSAGQPITDNFSAVTARYVRLNVTGASGYSGSWVSITELEMVTDTAGGGGDNGGGDNGGGGGDNGGGGDSDLLVRYREGDGGNATNNRLKPFFDIRNDGSSSVALSSLSIRYYFSLEGGGAPVFTCDYADIGKSNVTGSFTNLGGSNYYLEVGFTNGAGNLAAGADSGDVKVRIRASNWANQNESNDGSYDASVTSYTPYQDIVLLQNGTIVYGSQP